MAKPGPKATYSKTQSNKLCSGTAVWGFLALGFGVLHLWLGHKCWARCELNLERRAVRRALERCHIVMHLSLAWSFHGPIGNRPCHMDLEAPSFYNHGPLIQKRFTWATLPCLVNQSEPDVLSNKWVQSPDCSRHLC